MENTVYVLHCDYANDFDHGYTIAVYKNLIDAQIQMFTNCADYIEELVKGKEEDWEIEESTIGVSIKYKDDYNKYHSSWIITQQRII